MTEGKTLDVYYHGNHVGVLAQTPDKRVAFQYASDWQREGFAISPFSLPLRNEVFIPKESSREAFRGLFGVFADSLPDSWGELLLDRHLSSIGIRPADISVLDRFAYIGSGGMGALEYYPARNADYNIDRLGLNYDEIAGECDKLLSAKTTDQLDMLYGLAGSSGGTRPKILLKDGDREWIIKFPANNDPSFCGKREYDYSLCAKGCGINMTETQLIDSKICEGYFKTERFDRNQGEKVLTATFAGILEADYRAPSCDYETFMKLVRVLTKENEQDIEQMYLQMCFNVFAHNRDDHTKNFSFLFTEDKGWRLSPAYDLTYSDTYFGEHTTSVNGKGRDILEADLIAVGKTAGLSKTKSIELMETVRDRTTELKEYL